MTPEELQQNFVITVLYYCGVINNDPIRYFGFDPFLLSPDIGVLLYDTNDELYVAVWNMNYGIPSNATLQDYELLDVLTFYENAYKNPQLIITSQPYAQLTTTEMNNAEISELRQDSIITNTTVNRNYKLRGSSWVIGDPQPVHTSQHIGVVNVSFNQNQVKSVAYTATEGLNNNFTLNTTTGARTYNGPTKTLKICYVFSVMQNSLSTSGTLESFVNINGNVTSIPVSQSRSSVSWAAVNSLNDAVRLNVTVRDFISCSTGDVITLGAFFSAGNAQTINYYDISCFIEGSNTF